MHVLDSVGCAIGAIDGEPVQIMRRQLGEFDCRGAHRAHELFEKRGREEGREFDDWLRAEHELRESNDDDASE